MRLTRSPLDPAGLLTRLPFRVRLAAAFSGLFLLAGVVLLAFVVVLARYGTAQEVRTQEITRVVPESVPSGGASPVSPDAWGGTGRGAQPSEARPGGGTVRLPPEAVAIRLVDQTVQAVQDAALRQMLLWSAVGLAVMALLAGLMGWWLAGRALRPISAMTDTARRISDHTLHERLALTGPDDELHKLADTFDSMLDRLEGSFESQRRFVANASHELRTPLAVQRTSLEVGLADPLPEGLAEVREDLLTTNREAEQLIDALLLLARSDRGVEDPEPVELAETARLAVAELAGLAKERGVGLRVTADGPLKILGDPVLVRHLIGNLVRNAIQYNHPGGTVDVTLRDRALTVTNTGGPVDPARIPTLFEPFRRLGQDRTGTTGHGLGLSIVRSIAEAHNTPVHAEPGPSGGLKVRIEGP
ncbi:sensor histidine kinase [Streptomyces sp. NPDC091292]|uniref:sensor histidine kinase n=1 Tax=Streptomyces sp. NPDC091292 TaxID=3365991 RepID=UPI003809500E